jgi:hypothetical protein
MHPTIEQLLAYRDGETDPTVTAHVAGCARCRRDVEHFRVVREGLRDLPAIGPSRDVWPEIEASFEHRGNRARSRRLAVAAAVVLAIGGSGMMGWVVFRPSGGGPTAQPTATEARLAIDELVSASRELERLLERPELRSRVMGPRQAAMIVTLEDRIAGIDAAFSASTDSVPEEQALALWLERVRLLDALVQTRGAPASTPAVQYAVLYEGSSP